MDSPNELIAHAEARLEAAEASLVELNAELDALEAGLAELEADVERLAHSASSLGPWPSIRVGLAPPLAVLAGALFFDVGVWPLGLLSVVVAGLQVLLLPRLSRGGL
jgi:hypothetical protein